MRSTLQRYANDRYCGEDLTMEPEYLGDAVYASFDGYHIELRLNDHRSPPVVFLEPAVMDALINYYFKTKELRRQAND